MFKGGVGDWGLQARVGDGLKHVPLFLLSSCSFFFFFELVGAGVVVCLKGEGNHVIWETIIKEQDDNKKKATCLTRGNKKKRTMLFGKQA